MNPRKYKESVEAVASVLATFAPLATRGELLLVASMAVTSAVERTHANNPRAAMMATGLEQFHDEQAALRRTEN